LTSLDIHDRKIAVIQQSITFKIKIRCKVFTMTLATCAKDVKFYKWPSISYIGIYETPPECISVRTISWSCAGNEILAVKSKGNAVVMNAPQQPEDFVETFDLDVSHVTVGAFSSTNPNIIGFGCEDGRVFTYDLNTNMKFDRYSTPGILK
ncbi:unnamed protein product, partial [Callosobruchus maculatus]